MKRIREFRCAAAAALLALVLTGCAGGTSATTPEPTAKQRANAEKQEQLQEMLEKGQR